MDRIETVLKRLPLDKNIEPTIEAGEQNEKNINGRSTMNTILQENSNTITINYKADNLDAIDDNGVYTNSNDSMYKMKIFDTTLAHEMGHVVDARWCYALRPDFVDISGWEPLCADAEELDSKQESSASNIESSENIKDKNDENRFSEAVQYVYENMIKQTPFKVIKDELYRRGFDGEERLQITNEAKQKIQPRKKGNKKQSQNNEGNKKKSRNKKENDYVLNPISDCFRKGFTFEGRASRSEFWGNAIFYLGILIQLVSIGKASKFSGVFIGAIVIWKLVNLFPFWSAQVRRYHDVGLSGWAQFILHLLFIFTLVFADRLGIKNFRESLGFENENVCYVFIIISAVMLLINFVILALPGKSVANKYGINYMTKK